MCFSGYCLEGTVSVTELPEYPATMSVTSVFWSKSSGWDWVLNSASYPYVDGMRTLKSVISIIPSTVSPEVSPGFFLYHSHCNYFQVFFLADDIDILIGFFFFLNNKALHSHREAIVQGETYQRSIHSDGSWDCAGPYSFMKLQGNQDE